MKTVTLMVLVLEATLKSRAAAKANDDIPRVSAYVRHSPSEPPIQMLARAEALASRLFASTGVHIIWHAGVPPAMQRETLTLRAGLLAHVLAHEITHVPQGIYPSLQRGH